jgi:hypothetical protein
MLAKFSEKEKNTILILDSALQPKYVRQKIDDMAKRAVQKLTDDSQSDLAWESVPLDAYTTILPDVIRSSWVFVVRAGVDTGAERHPNSHQFMMSYKETGDLQIRAEGNWESNLLVSTPSDPIEKRWVSVPPNVWHKALASKENWIVVSFHTAFADELVEERPDPDDEKKLSQRLYVGKLKIE